MFGRRRVFLIGCIWMSIWTLICGFASGKFLLVSRGLQGIGAALNVPAAVGILGSCYEDGPRKNKALAAFGAGAPVGGGVGLVLGGVFTQTLGWRWSFYVSFMINVVIIILGVLSVPNDTPEQIDTNRSVDYGGAMLSAAGLLAFTYALTAAQSSTNGWKTPHIIALLILSVVLLGGFLYLESRVTSPLMPLGIWSYPYFKAIHFIALMEYASFASFVFYATLYSQNIDEASPLTTTVRFLPMATVGLLGNIVAGYIVGVVSGQLLLIIAMTASAAAPTLYALTQPDITYWAMSFPALCLVVIGVDLTYNITNLFVLTSVPPHQQSIAAGVFNTVTQVGSTVGLAVTSAIAAGVSAG
ncbi:hypothetical protein HK104_005431, partial [Borealophlyctis nickersoniae]